MNAATTPSMLKCSWPRTGTTITHRADFIGKADPSLKPLDPQREIRAYRLDAINGIRYAWNKAMGREHRDLTALPDSEIAYYRHHVPAPKPEMPTFVDHELLSKNGKRLPIAAFDYHELNRRFWLQGKTLYSTERKRAQELQAHDKPISEMSIDELMDTQDREPLSESRRAWLELGAKALRLENQDADEGSILDTMKDDGIFTASDENVATYDDVGDERNQQHFGTAYQTIDPITAKQIDWEKRVHGDGMLRTIKVQDGKVKPDRPYPTIEEFKRVAMRALKMLLPDAENDTLPRLSPERVRELCKKFDAYVENQVAYANEYAPKEWHGHFLDSAGWLHFHGTHPLSLEEQKYGPYHAVPQDRSELAIFNHEGPDEDIDYIMGCDPCDNDDCNGWIPRIDVWNPDAERVCDTCGTPAVPSLRFLAA